jgi:hypothetical protein
MTTTLRIHDRSARWTRAGLAALALAVPLLAAQAQTTTKKSAEEPSVAKKVGNTVERGVKAAASGVERGVEAAASGVRRAGDAVARGAQAAGSAVGKGARKIGVPSDSASAPKK